MREDFIAPGNTEDPVDARLRAAWVSDIGEEQARLTRNLQAKLHAPAFFQAVDLTRIPTETKPKIAEVTIRDEASSTTGVQTGSASVTPRRIGIMSPRYPRLRSIVAVSIFGLLLLATTWRIGVYQGLTTLQKNASIYTTANNERARVTLPDGTVVTLNVASRLEVPGNYVSGNRSVRLSGAAVFSVVSNVGSPFTVTAGAATTRVLGTRFSVRRYITDSMTVVAVQEGKVAVQSAVVVPGQQALVSDTGNPIVSHLDAGESVFAMNVLRLEGQPLIQAIPDLNRWYDADIRIGDVPVNTRRIGGEFAAGSINDLIAILESTFGIRVERSGRILTLYSR